jgi:hypothetical protein
VKTIPLTRGKVAIVDDEDFEYLSQWKWHCTNAGYAARRGFWGGWVDGKKMNGPMILMHRLVNNTPDGFDTDHINRDTLDNRKANLRTATRSENNRNSDPQKRNKSGYKGVLKRCNRWVASYKHLNGELRYIGSYATAEIASVAREMYIHGYFS